MNKITLWILSAFLICGCSQQSSKKEGEPAPEETETPAAQETEDPAEAAVFDLFAAQTPPIA